MERVLRKGLGAREAGGHGRELGLSHSTAMVIVV